MNSVPEELWKKVHNIVQEAMNKTIPKEKKSKKAEWLSEEALEIAKKQKGSEKQRRRRKVYPTKFRVPKNCTETQEGLLK